jgi:hypothetical protein
MTRTNAPAGILALSRLADERCVAALQFLFALALMLAYLLGL